MERHQYQLIRQTSLDARWTRSCMDEIRRLGFRLGIRSARVCFARGAVDGGRPYARDSNGE